VFKASEQETIYGYRLETVRRSRAAYHKALDEYIKIDRTLAELNKVELPAKKAPNNKAKRVKSKKEELQELAKQVGRDDLLNIINEKEKEGLK